jgi:altronate dehydratase small subunit
MVKGRAEAILIDEKDNVAVALEALAVGKTVSIDLPGKVQQIKMVSEVPKGHKFALRELPAGTAVIKYGQPIGYSTKRIVTGEHVHVHNVTSHQGADR